MFDETSMPATESVDSDATENEGGQAPALDEGRPDDHRDQRYRQRLRETEQTLEAERAEREAERTQHQQIIERLQRDSVNRAVNGRLADPDDLWRDGLAMADVLTEGGDVDIERLDAVVSECLQRHPHYAPRPPAAAPSSLVGFGAVKPPTGDHQDDWVSAFAPRD